MKIKKKQNDVSFNCSCALYVLCVFFRKKKRKILFQLFPLNVHYYIYFNHLARWFINKNIVSRYMIYIIIFFIISCVCSALSEKFLSYRFFFKFLFFFFRFFETFSWIFAWCGSKTKSILKFLPSARSIFTIYFFISFFNWRVEIYKHRNTWKIFVVCSFYINISLYTYIYI